MKKQLVSERLLVGLFIWAVLMSVLLILISMRNGERVDISARNPKGIQPKVESNLPSSEKYPTPCPSGFVMLYEGGIETGCSLLAK